MSDHVSLHIENLSKQFPGVRALDGVSFDVQSGEVVGLVGVNGAGKSTLMNILGGIHSPDDGRILIDGQEVAIRSPRGAEDLGIAFIQQEIQVFDTLKVFENIFIADLHKWRISKLLPFLNASELRSQSVRYLGMLGSDIDVNGPVGRLVVGEQQMVQIARALCQGGRILLFDEPTSSLSAKEKERLFGVVRKLKASGLAVVYISHHLDEIFEICDRVVVLRDGAVTGSGNVRDLTKRQLVNYMIGRDIDSLTESQDRELGEVILDVKGLTGEKYPVDVDLSLREREIVGVWGLMGSGRTELIRTLLGFEKMKGEIFYRKDNELERVNGTQLFREVGYLTESRHLDGLFLQMPLWQNISSVVLRRFASRFLRVLRRSRETHAAKEYMAKVNIKAVDETMLTYQLSGGNQQKVVIAKWFMKDPRILFMDEPTKGVDVAAKAEIQNMIFEYAKAGMSFIIVSSELEEIMGMCDRVIVLHNGRIVSEIPKEEFSEDRLMDVIAMGEA